MIEIANHTKIRLPLGLLLRAGENVLAREKKERGRVSVACVGEARMRALNKRYRGKEYVANVLSFAGDGKELGEVVLCPLRIRKDAAEYGIIFKEALARMLVHGLLHLIGYDHEKSGSRAGRMERKEKEYCREAFLPSRS